MPSGNQMYATATVVEIMKQGTYRVQLANGHRCIARASGELRLAFVRLALGDRVRLEFNPYDLARARILPD
jgi:translation initiation factor IF-1